MMSSSKRGGLALLVILGLFPGVATAQDTREEGVNFPEPTGRGWYARGKAYFDELAGDHGACARPLESPVNVVSASRMQNLFATGGGTAAVSSVAAAFATLQDTEHTYEIDLLRNRDGKIDYYGSQPVSGTLFGFSKSRYDIFHMRQIHFHYPSEHLIDDERFPMEMHVVFDKGPKSGGDPFPVRRNPGLVMAVLLKIDDNVRGGFLRQVFADMRGPRRPVERSITDAQLVSLFPGDTTYVTYEGSLTTPPCTGGIRWLVMLNPVAVTRAEVETFRALHPMNARPLQALGRREFVRSKLLADTDDWRP